MAVDRRELGAIFLGGFAGAVARAGLTEVLPSNAGTWPWATFLVNLGGAFLLGYLATRFHDRLPRPAYRRALLETGFCGGLTTFSTMQLELVRMLDSGAPALALAYALASIVGGLAAVGLATNLVRRVTPPG